MTPEELEADERALGAEIKAGTLIESLGWLKRFSGKIVVVKFGGNAMVSGEPRIG
jgi:acetylglutamate kinase